jgi:hypothetical protein
VRAPAIVTDRQDLDDVGPAIDGFGESVSRHGVVTWPWSNPLLLGSRRLILATTASRASEAECEAAPPAGDAAGFRPTRPKINSLRQGMHSPSTDLPQVFHSGPSMPHNRAR